MDKIRDLRIYNHHRFSFDRGEPVKINFEGKRLLGYSKEPVAVALFAAGIPVTMRSFKFHRPRGVFCLNGKCASCLMRIGGLPNQRACRIRCSDGLIVQRQNAFPNAGNDLLFINDFLFPKKLDYHHIMTNPGWLSKTTARVVRAFSGLGDLPDSPPETMPVIRDVETEVLIVGAGPAGIAAALAAQSAGAEVILLDEHKRPGGHLKFYPEKIDADYTGMGYSAERASRIIEKGIRYFAENEVVGYYEEGFFVAVKEGQLLRLHPKRTILATGGYDQNFRFAQNDLPNILSARAMMRLTNLWGVCPGVRIFLLGSNDETLSLALRLSEIGVRIAGIAELGRTVQGNPAWAEKIMAAGVPIFLGYKPRRAVGRFHLKGIELEPLAGGEPVKTHCDLIAVGAPPAPSFELAAQAGVRTAFIAEKGGYVPEHDNAGRTPVPSIFVAGEITGEMPASESRLRGRIAGLSAANDLHPKPQTQHRIAKLMEALPK